jgi:hypothetical protein
MHKDVHQEAEEADSPRGLAQLGVIPRTSRACSLATALAVPEAAPWIGPTYDWAVVEER